MDFSSASFFISFCCIVCSSYQILSINRFSINQWFSPIRVIPPPRRNSIWKILPPPFEDLWRVSNNNPIWHFQVTQIAWTYLIAFTENVIIFKTFCGCFSFVVLEWRQNIWIHTILEPLEITIYQKLNIDIISLGRVVIN